MIQSPSGCVKECPLVVSWKRVSPICVSCLVLFSNSSVPIRSIHRSEQGIVLDGKPFFIFGSGENENECNGSTKDCNLMTLATGGLL